MKEVNGAFCYRWEDLPQDTPMPQIDRRRIMGKKAMLSEVFLHKGCSVPTHAHENEQFACVVSGRMRFGLGEDGDEKRRFVELGAGEVLHVPSWVPHSADALEDSLVLDVFSPVSEGTGLDVHSKG